MVYVDKLIVYKGGKSCRMSADTFAELESMAKLLKLNKDFYDVYPVPHYDLKESKRRDAVRLGAAEVDNFSFLG